MKSGHLFAAGSLALKYRASSSFLTIFLAKIAARSTSVCCVLHTGKRPEEQSDHACLCLPSVFCSVQTASATASAGPDDHPPTRKKCERILQVNGPDQGAGSSVFAAGHQPNSVRGYRCCSVRANPGASRLALSCYDRAFAISGLLSVRLMSWRTSGMPLRKMISGFELSQIAPKSFFSNAVRDLCCGSTFLFGSLDYLTKGLA